MNPRPKLSLFLLLAVCILVVLGQAVWTAQADSTATSPGIGWAVLSAGAQASSSGQITINATLGQPVIGDLSKDTTLLQSGYWVRDILKWVRCYLPIVRK